MPLLSYRYVGPRSHCFGGLLMTPEQLKALEDLPLGDARSPLEPFKLLILRWRRQGRSYRKILRLLRNECHIEVAYGPLYRFVKRRSRPRKPQPDIDLEPATVQSPLFTPKASTATAITPPIQGEHSTDPYAEVRERMRKHKEAPPLPKPRKVFELPEEDDDEIKPFRMMPPTTQKEK